MPPKLDEVEVNPRAEDIIRLADLVAESEIVELELTDQSILKRISSVFYHDDRYIIADKGTKAVENKTNWRTAAFDHIFWLNQAGKATQEYGVRFEEDFTLEEAFGDDIFIDAHARIRTDLDAILSGEIVESVKKSFEEDSDLFMDAHAGVKTNLDDILSNKEELNEHYRRITSRGATLVENELFIDFD